MAQTYFVTGATGFIGRRLAQRLLHSGARVRLLVRSEARAADLQALGAEIIVGDLFCEDAIARGVRECDAVLHLAGLTREQKRGDFQRVNVLGTRAIADACRRADRVPTLVYVSSLASAGRAPRAEPTDANERYGANRLMRETDAPRPISSYGRSKYDAEQALLTYALETPITIVRPPYVFGEGDLVSAKLYAMAKRRGNFVVPGWKDRFYSFVYVDDLVDVLLASVDCGERLTPNSLELIADAPERCSGVGIYFASSPRPIRFSEFGRFVGRAYGREKMRIFKIPPLGVLGAGAWGEFVKSIFHCVPSFDWNKSIEALRGPWICSSAKARDQLGVELKDDLALQFAAAARWYEEQGMA